MGVVNAWTDGTPEHIRRLPVPDDGPNGWAWMHSAAPKILMFKEGPLDVLQRRKEFMDELKRRGVVKVVNA